MEPIGSFDLLLIEGIDATRRAWEQALRAEFKCRIKSQASAREALASYARTRLDGIVCGTEFADTDCWRFLSMIRSGRFGFPETPAYVICEPDEFSALVSLLDPHTRLVDAPTCLRMAQEVAQRVRGTYKASVLIVEDDREAAEAARRALDKHFEIEVCYDGAQALATWGTHRHDLVLLDLMLPGITGSEVLQEILSAKPDQPVVILTAHDAPERHAELMLCGARRYLAKPFDVNQLPSVCASVLRDAECLKRAADACDRGSEVAARIQAADYTLRSGRTAEASHHLLHALQACRTQMVSDDHWAEVLAEFPGQRNPHA